MTKLSKPTLYCGAKEFRPQPLNLRSGPVTLLFEPDTGFLRQIRIGDHEVVRAIYAAVRDRNWDTIPVQISNLASETGPDTFQVKFEAVCKQGEIDFCWKGTITGDAQARVTYRLEGEARSTFLKNRVGLCVLHPIVECAGKPCRVEHVDGSLEDGSFPQAISPHQPFKNIRALRYDLGPGARAEIRFEGETFEMEDQRNWTDASFKTYSTPLELPMPAKVEKGTRLTHTVTVSVSSERKILPVVQGRGAQFSIATTPVLQKPPIGLCLPSHAEPLSPIQIQRLKALALSHLRVDLRLRQHDWLSRFRRAADEAAQIGASLHLALHLTEAGEAELDAVARETSQISPRLGLWLIFHESGPVTPDCWLQRAREKLSSVAPNVLFASGTDAYFVEINRSRPAPSSTALPCFSLNPQVHAIDNLTMIENLAGQVAAVESTQKFCSQAVVVSPITLRARTNPEADSSKAATELPFSVDPRQLSLFGAGWTLGSLARLSNAGNVHSLTYYETTGWNGVMETEKGSPLPDQFPSAPGSVFPMYHVFADLAGFSRIYPTHSSHPLQTEGLTLVDENNRRRILVANLLAETQEIKIKTGTCRARVRYLDETNAEEAMTAPERFRGQTGESKESASGKLELKLLPYALARVDVDS